ncbi:unnamed protein product [Orchesella dallaii]|uniref:Uncharacterized protein n=1 Tax=Orchesella dallaii TaxID=48710 RepID=A0ABP1RVN9_9HEXA
MALKNYLEFRIKIIILLCLEGLVSSSNLGEIEKERNCLPQLLPTLNRNWEHYVIYFYNMTSTSTAPKIQPEKSLFPRVVSLNNASLLSRGNYRFSNTFDVLLSHLEYGYELSNINNTINILSEKVVPSRALFLFVWVNLQKEIPQANIKLARWHPILPVFPALKIILTLHKNLRCHANDTTSTFICSNYCRQSQPTIPLLDFDAQLKKHDFYSLRNFLFKNGNGNFIIAMTYDMFNFIGHTPPQNRNFCLSQKVRLHSKCSKVIMSLVTFGEKHNLTILFYQNNRFNIRKFPLQFSGPESFYSVTLTNPAPIPMSFIAQLAFDGMDSKIITYCPRLLPENPNTFQFGVWYEPFTTEIWVVVLIFIFCLILYCYKAHTQLEHFLVQLLNCLVGVSGGSVSLRYFVIVSAIAFILNQIYSNGLASVVAVMLQPEGFKFIKDLLGNNYKIIFDHVHERFTSAEETYGDAFKLLGLSAKEAFFDNHNAYRAKQIVVLMGETRSTGPKLAMLSDVSMIPFQRALNLNVLQSRFNTTFNCFTIPQPFLQMQHSWVMHIEIEEKVKESLQRIIGSGLYYKWHEWSIWHRMLKDDLLKRDTSIQSDLVNFQKWAIKTRENCIEAWKARMARRRRVPVPITVDEAMEISYEIMSIQVQTQTETN